MSYTWTTGEVITAEKLNSMGEVIYIPVTDDYGVYSTDVSFEDAVYAITHGNPVQCYIVVDGYKYNFLPKTAYNGTDKIIYYDAYNEVRLIHTSEGISEDDEV